MRRRPGGRRRTPLVATRRERETAAVRPLVPVVILPDAVELQAETVEGTTTFRYREFFRRPTYFGAPRAGLIKNTAATFVGLLEQMPGCVLRTGRDWIEVAGQVPREVFARMMLGEFSHWGADDLVQSLGRSSKARIVDGAARRTKRGAAAAGGASNAS